jgi:hypothetical protein
MIFVMAARRARCADGAKRRAGMTAPEAEQDIPLGQRLYDRPFLLLAFGLVVMFVFYTIWGLVEVMSLPQAPLP